METPTDRVRALWRKHASMKGYNDAQIFARTAAKIIREVERQVRMVEHVLGSRR